MKKIIIRSLIMLLACSDLFSEIVRKNNPDGSVEYSNHPPKKMNLPLKNLSMKYDHIIEPLCEELALDPRLIKCIIRIESDFDPDAVSPAGAMGLMQLMGDTAKHYGVRDPFDPSENINAGCRHFKAMLDYFKGDIELALAAYHAGAYAVKKRMSIPPIKSTIDYVNAVMMLYSGKPASVAKIKRLYKKFDTEGDIIIYSR